MAYYEGLLASCPTTDLTPPTLVRQRAIGISLTNPFVAPGTTSMDEDPVAPEDMDEDPVAPEDIGGG